VENIIRKGEMFHVQTSAGEIRTRRVVLAMGRRGTPRRLGCPGEELPKVYYDIVEMEAFQQRRILVVGGGDSAVESAVGLANQPGTQVVLSYRKDRLDRPNERNRTKLEEAIRAKKVFPLFGSRVREIRTGAVVLDVKGQARLLPNDFVIVRIGGDPPRGFLERIGVRIVEKDVPLPAEGPRVARAS
jgi:thioredoxin reductase